MFKLTPELAEKSANNDAFFAVRCGGGKMVIAGKHGSMEVHGEGIRLGQRFFNTPHGVIVREGELEDYNKMRNQLDTTVARLRKVAENKVISYSQLLKKKKPRKRR